MEIDLHVISELRGQLPVAIFKQLRFNARSP